MKGGTDKQIRYAEDIREEWISRAETSLATSFMAMLKSFSAERVSKPSGNKNWVKALDDFRRQYLAVETLLSLADNAVWWIERGRETRNKPITMKGYFVPHDMRTGIWEEDDRIKEGVEKATGVKDGYLLVYKGDGLEFNFKPGASGYLNPAYSFAEWLDREGILSASVGYEDLERFADK